MSDAVAEYIAEVVNAFAFLTDDAGFVGPQRDPRHVRWRHGTLRVEVAIPGFREPTVSTRLVKTAPDGQKLRGIEGSWLPEIYSAVGYGPRHDVPADASTLEMARENVRLQAAILRRALPLLLTDNGQLTPLGEELAGRRWKDRPQAMQ